MPAIPIASLPDLASQLVAALGVGTLVVDPDDRVVLANPAAVSLQVVEGRKVAVPALTGLVHRARRTLAQAKLALDLCRRSDGGDPIAIEATAVPLQAGDRAGYVGLLLVDVTDQRRLEAVRRDFVANVSHELKTPVGALTLLAEAVHDAADDPGAVARFAGRMRHEAARLSRLVCDLMELSRVQGAAVLPGTGSVRLQQVLAGAVRRTKEAAGRASVPVEVRCAEDLLVRGDAEQLTVAVANLILNAVAYSAPGTAVTVAAGAAEDGGGRACAEISVTDHGVGIAAAELDRIFERFYRVDPARSRATGGTGLGLAIVKNIVANHRGTVSARSAAGQGSTFYIRLPRARPGPRAARRSAHPPPAGPPGRFAPSDPV